MDPSAFSSTEIVQFLDRPGHDLYEGDPFRGRVQCLDGREKNCARSGGETNGTLRDARKDGSPCEDEEG